MEEFIELARGWIFLLGDKYGVNPIYFGSIYLGAIPLFLISISWLIKNFRKKKSIVLPALSAVCCFISAYVYLIIAGENVPWWVYGIVVLVLFYGVWATYLTVRKKLKLKDIVHE